MKSRNKIDECAVTEGCGNVFKDLGLPNAEVLQVRADLLFIISRAIEAAGLSGHTLAKTLGVSSATATALMNGHLGRFSIERLVKFLNALNQDVKIVVRPRRSATRGRLAVG
jgi:predicted XRE-type DNA-binding protein